MKVYWSSIEFTYSKDSPDFKKYKGGLVYAFVNSKDAQRAFGTLS